MNTIKTIFVAATLLAVGYGTHRVLNGPANTELANEMWNINNVAPGSSEMNIPDFAPSPGSDLNPFQPPSPNANPFQPPPVQPPHNTSQLRANSQIPGLNSDLVNVPPPNQPFNDSNRLDLGIPNFPPTGKQSPIVYPTLPVQTPPAQENPQPFNGSGIPSSPNRVTDSGPIPESSTTFAIPDIDSRPAPGGGDTTNFQQPILPPVDTPPVQMPQAQTPSIQAPPASPAKDVGQIFATTWQKAQSQLGAGELASALESLSSIYNEPLSNSQRGQLVALLDQLAGTVIYSQQHLISPAYTPRPAETIAQIATRQRVPADFLARINGISPHQPLDQSVKLKTITGPFRGELSQSRRELTLFLGPHYAGRFAVSIGTEFPQQVSSFEVVEKGGARPYVDPRTGQQIPAGSTTNPYGSHWIGLRAAGDASPNVRFGMHSIGTSLDVSDSRGCIGLSNEDADDLKAILELSSQIDVLP